MLTINSPDINKVAMSLYHIKKMSVLKKLVKELKSLDQCILLEIRVELSVGIFYVQ